LWLCDTLEAPLRERPRWTPPQGFVADRSTGSTGSTGEAGSTGSTGDDRGFSIRISRRRSSDPA